VITIRPLTDSDADLDGLTRLMNQWDDLPDVITRTSLEEKVQIIKTRPHSEVFLACEGDAIVGFAYVSECIFLGLDSYLEVQAILVDKAHRKSGVGKALMRHIEQWAKGQGFPKVALSSRSQLTGAHAFYEELGYTEYKRSIFFSKKV
jgi:GNAT superfamily N-acetyltransferase